MKVFYFLTKSEEGGAQSVVFELLRGHKERGDSVQVMAHGNGWLAQQTRALGFAYCENPYMRKTYNPLTLLRAARVYRRAAHDGAPEIISLHSSFSGLVGRLAAPKKIPVVFTAHGWGFTPGVSRARAFVARTVERCIAPYAKAIICVSEFDHQNALKSGVGVPSQLVTIHNGVDVLTYKKPVENHEKVEMLFVARFAKPKLQTLLVEALEQMSPEERAKMHVTFVGHGPQRAVFEAIVASKGLGDIVSVQPTSREQALTLMAQSDVLILLSRWEGLPMVLLEALQLGVPVIASDVGGVSEVVDSTVGVCVKNTPEDVVSALRVAIDAAWRASRREAATIRGEQYSAARMCTAVFDLYARLLT